ncbi:Microtubule-associated protein 9 [Merluccius polli]|uniref:Microtubule-associated protein 9 n=1 Tax=Merluccius polli TaxID=89951 RepID=A0AA47MEP6_MERPO|nr:Microtubule-associated protein 9 [Merluccius polli]
MVEPRWNQDTRWGVYIYRSSYRNVAASRRVVEAVRAVWAVNNELSVCLRERGEEWKMLMSLIEYEYLVPCCSFHGVFAGQGWEGFDSYEASRVDRMTDTDFMTLAHPRTPKGSRTRRTTFQDELEAVVSARASRTKADRRLGSRRNRASAFKAGRSKAKINDFDLSDDESKIGATKKRVSFLKTQRSSPPLESTSPEDAPEKGRPDGLAGGPSDRTRPRSASFNEEDSSERSGASLRSSPRSRHASDDNSQVPKSPLTSPSDGGGATAGSPTPPPGDGEEKRNSVEDDERPNSRSPKPRTGTVDTPETDGAAGRPTPRPRPRPRGASSRAAEETPTDPQSSQSLPSPPAGSLTHSPPGSPVDGVTPKVHSPHGSEGGDTTSSSNNQSMSLPRSEQLGSRTGTTMDSASQDRLNSADSNEHERKYSTSFEEFQEDLEEQLDPARHHHSNGNITDSRSSSSLTRSSGRPRSACVSSRVESRYMGSTAPGQPPLDTGDSLRAVVYQEWLRKKQETWKDRKQRKKKEESLKEEKKKTDESDKRENALASFEAWKEKKSETLKAKAKENEARLRKQQKAVEDLEEKKQMAKGVFEQWKKGHDELLKEKHRKQKEDENKLKQKKLEKEEERKINSKYAISDWNEKKKNVLCDKVTIEHKKSKTTAEKERGEKEERDKMALDMYEKWLVRKERDLRRQKEERRIQAILQDSPPPPWSPPNKTIPFRK